MKALIYEAPQTLTYRDAPDPAPAAGEHLIEIEAVGICGSDMHAYLGHDERRPAPLILGHEAAGTIISGDQAGRRVTINPLVNCGTCSACISGRENLCPKREIISMPPREGAFAQYITMPEANLVTVPEHVSFDKAALCEPLAVSWHAVRLGLEALHPSAQRKAIVVGGGAIGVAAALALQAMGVDDLRVVEPNAARRDYLNRHCAFDSVEAHLAPAPLIIDAVGLFATRAAASTLVEPGGVIVHIGLGDAKEGLDIRRMTLQEITFIGTYTYSAEDFKDTAKALFDGALGPLDWVTHRPLSDGALAFSDILGGLSAAPKTILYPHS